MKAILYKKAGRPWSAAVIAFLDELDVSYEIKNITTHSQYAEELEKIRQLHQPNLEY